jgi:arabinogalactan endo-1,4-beta-galactosidase
VIVHLSNGFDNSLFQWFFDGIKNAGAKWDIIGMSHYPALDADASQWQTKNGQIGTTMANMVKRYAKPVAVVEVGMAWDQASTPQAMIADLVKRVKALGNNGIGNRVFIGE